MSLRLRYLAQQCAKTNVLSSFITFELRPFRRQHFQSVHINRKEAKLNNNYLNRSYCDNMVNNCWSCQKKVAPDEMFFCDNCGSLQEVKKNLNYFKLLELDYNFDVDSTKLTSNFRKMQSYVHPDKYNNKSDTEQINSQEWSSLLNKAYKTLLVPIDRGIYILELNGIDLPEDNSVLNKEFLLEMMERNEEVEEANESNVLQLQEKSRTDLESEAEKLKNVLSKSNYDEAKLILIKMKYFKSLEKNIKEKKDILGVVQ